MRSGSPYLSNQVLPPGGAIATPCNPAQSQVSQGFLSPLRDVEPVVMAQGLREFSHSNLEINKTKTFEDPTGLTRLRWHFWPRDC